MARARPGLAFCGRPGGRSRTEGWEGHREHARGRRAGDGSPGRATRRVNRSSTATIVRRNCRSGDTEARAAPSLAAPRDPVEAAHDAPRDEHRLVRRRRHRRLPLGSRRAAREGVRAARRSCATRGQRGIVREFTRLTNQLAIFTRGKTAIHGHRGVPRGLPRARRRRAQRAEQDAGARATTTPTPSSPNLDANVGTDVVARRVHPDVAGAAIPPGVLHGAARRLRRGPRRRRRRRRQRLVGGPRQVPRVLPRSGRPASTTRTPCSSTRRATSSTRRTRASISAPTCRPARTAGPNLAAAYQEAIESNAVDFVDGHRLRALPAVVRGADRLGGVADRRRRTRSSACWPCRSRSRPSTG